MVPHKKDPELGLKGEEEEDNSQRWSLGEEGHARAAYESKNGGVWRVRISLIAQGKSGGIGPNPVVGVRIKFALALSGFFAQLRVLFV